MKQVFKEQLEKFETVILGILILYESIYLVCEKIPTRNVNNENEVEVNMLNIKLLFKIIQSNMNLF